MNEAPFSIPVNVIEILHYTTKLHVLQHYSMNMYSATTTYLTYTLSALFNMSIMLSKSFCLGFS